MSVGPESHYHAFFLRWPGSYLVLNLGRDQNNKLSHFVCWSKNIFSIFIYLFNRTRTIQQSHPNKFQLIILRQTSSKAAFDFDIHWPNDFNFFKWFPYVSPNLLMCSILYPLQRWPNVALIVDVEIFRPPIDQTRSVNCTLFSKQKCDKLLFLFIFSNFF